MSWYKKEQPTPFDDLPIPGLQFLDGDMLALLLNQSWTRNQKYPIVVFPSGVKCDIWESGDPKNYGVMHLFQLHRVVKKEISSQPIAAHF
jgi:hypothetical protein